MKRLIFLCMMILPILTCRAQWLKPDIKTAEYPIVEICDPSLEVAVKNAIAALVKEYDGFEFFIVALRDSIPTSDVFSDTVYAAFEPQQFLTFGEYAYDKDAWPTEYNGVCKVFCEGKFRKMFFAGELARVFCRRKGDEIYSYRYDANFCCVGETPQIAIRYDRGAWSMVKDSLRY